MVSDKKAYHLSLITYHFMNMHDMPVGERPHERFEQVGARGLSSAELSKNPKLTAEIDQFIESVNSKLARYETIKKFTILPEEFTTANGYLTPSMKIKRKVVESDFVGALDKMYGE